MQNKKTLGQELFELLLRYEKVKCDLIDFDSMYHDSILFDMEGYFENFNSLDYNDFIKLKQKVRNFENLVRCLKNIDKIGFEYC